MDDSTPYCGSRIAIGTAQFGLDYGVTNTSGQVSPVEVSKILEAAKRFEVNTLDTASTYGNSEQVLGQAGVSPFRVVTKLPSIPKGISIKADWVIEQGLISASNLRRKDISALLVHNTADLSGPNSKELIRGLNKCKELGITQKIGVSIYDPKDLSWISRIMGLDIVQAPLNVFDRRMIDSGWLSLLSEKDIEVHVRSVFLQGSLLAGVANLPDFLRPWISKFAEFESWTKSEGLSLLEGALIFPLSIQEVDKILIGVVSVDQFESALIATKRPHLKVPDFGTSDQLLINPVNWAK
jgi:aryl-alcohol dehydrogenase-like predicted oxidoreductase